MRPAATLLSLLVLLAPMSGVAAGARARATVTHVTDGDTAYLKPLRFGKTVQSWSGRSARFIGVDTPEVYGTDECFGPQASAFTTRKLEGERVRIQYGK